MRIRALFAGWRESCRADRCLTPRPRGTEIAKLGSVTKSTMTITPRPFKILLWGETVPPQIVLPLSKHNKYFPYNLAPNLISPWLMLRVSQVWHMAKETFRGLPRRRWLPLLNSKCESRQRRGYVHVVHTWQYLREGTFYQIPLDMFRNFSETISLDKSYPNLLAAPLHFGVINHYRDTY